MKSLPLHLQKPQDSLGGTWDCPMRPLMPWSQRTGTFGTWQREMYAPLWPVGPTFKCNGFGQ